MPMTTIHLKVDTRLKKAFDDRASKMGRPSDMLRTLMEAFAENRVKVYPTEEQLELFQTPTKGDVK